MPFSQYDDATAIGSVRNQLQAARQESQANCQSVEQFRRMAEEDFDAAAALTKEVEGAIDELVLTQETVQKLRAAQDTLRDVRDTAQGWLQSNRQVIEQCKQ